MTSYFEQLFKKMFLERYSQSDNSENTKERPITRLYGRVRLRFNIRN